MTTQLTKNAINSLINSTNPEEQYVIQILQAPTFVAESLYKINISDGFCKFKKGYFVSDAATKCHDLKELSVIKCKKFIDESNQDKERIIISSFDVVCPNVTEVIGKPIEFKNYKQNNMQNPEGSTIIPPKYLSRNAQVIQQTQATQPKQMNVPANNNLNKPANNNYNLNNNQAQKPAPSNQNMNRVTGNPNQMTKSAPVNQSSTLATSTEKDEENLESIRQLTQNSGQPQAFKARITKKGNLKSYGKEKVGQLFSMDVVDANGDETTVSFFNDVATRFDGQFKEGQVLIFKNFSVKPNTNTQYNKGDQCVTINKDSQIFLSHDDGQIPITNLKKKTIADLQAMEQNSNIDLVIMVKQDTTMKNTTLKSGNQQMRRDIIAFDESMVEIEITIWGDKAQQYDLKQHDVIVLKDARVGQYREKKQINIGFGTQIYVNPDASDFPSVESLRNWVASLNNEQINSFQKTSNGGDSGPREVTSYESSLAILKEEIGKSNLDDQFKLWKEVRVQVTFIKDTPLYYNACPVCKKKVVQDNESWYCAAESTHHAQPDSRYIFSMVISDSSDTMWVSAFDEIGQRIFGCSANEFRLCDADHEHGLDKKRKLIMAAQNKEYRFLLLTRAEGHNGQFKEKTVVHAFKDVQPAYEAKKILNSLTKYLEIAN